MRRFVNPGNTAFEVAVNSQIYVDFREVKRWYDGYELGNYHVYNPNAVVNVMIIKAFKAIGHRQEPTSRSSPLSI